MAHGFMGLRLSGYISLVATGAFLAYLATSYKGPVGPKFQVHPLALEVAMETQPGLNKEFYLNNNNNNNQKN